jgi:hypothetical protein
MLLFEVENEERKILKNEKIFHNLNLKEKF